MNVFHLNRSRFRRLPGCAAIVAAFWLGIAEIETAVPASNREQVAPTSDRPWAPPNLPAYDAIHSGALAKPETQPDPVFGLAVVTQCANVPGEILIPRNAWPDKAAYDTMAAGCTMVVKPAESTPLSAFALAVLAERAGIPAGVLNVLTGKPRAIGGEMTSNPDVRKIAFTGSTGVGRLLMRQSANTIKKLSLELGGNAPLIVFDDADLDAAVEGTIISKFRNTGQTCVCANRVYVQDGVYDAYAEGREGSHYGIDEFLEVKYPCFGGLDR